MCQDTPIEVKNKVSVPFLTPSGAWGLNSDSQAGLQMSLPDKPSHQPGSLVLAAEDITEPLTIIQTTGHQACWCREEIRLHTMCPLQMATILVPFSLFTFFLFSISLSAQATSSVGY